MNDSVIFTLRANADIELTCIVCKLQRCELSFQTIGGGYHTWFGIHVVCSEPYRSYDENDG